MTETIYQITGMDCAECAQTVQKGVGRLSGVNAVQVDFMTGKMRLDGQVTNDQLRQRLQALGYGLADSDSNKSNVKPRNAIVGFIIYLAEQYETRLALLGMAIMLATALAGLIITSDISTPSNIIYTLATLVAVYPIAKSGIRTFFINRDFNINLLMTIAACGAILIGEYFEGAAVIILFAIGEALEGYTADRARDSLRQLLSLAPSRAIRLMGDLQEDVPVEALTIGDRILVKPGERIPMDGVVVSGESGVHQAPITGESIPVHKIIDDEVFAGTINGDGALEITVARLAQDNTLSRIIQLVEDAQSERAPSQRLIDRFARVYTPAVVIIALFTAIVPPLIFNAPFYDTPEVRGWLYRSLALLVIACPCALVISTPVTVISAITAAARRGVLIKGGAHLESLGRIKAFAFDKTGTLTHGKPVVTQVRSADCATGDPCADCDEVLALAAAVEKSSSHPLAQAVIDSATAHGVNETYAPAIAVESIAGRGVQGDVGDYHVTVGSHRLFDEQYPHSDAMCDWVDTAEAQGQTTMLVHDGERARGYIAVADEPREDSRDVIARLKTLGVQTVMLTGDNRTVADAVGSAVGVDDVRAELLPEDKVSAVQGLLAQYKAVGMVGDGINDTPALATATVGIAMGGAGSSQAMETADIALMADDLTQLPYAVRLSRFARRLIAWNVALSLGMKLVFMALALVGGATLWMAVFADVGMALIVTLNGMRPLRMK